VETRKNTKAFQECLWNFKMDVALKSVVPKASSDCFELKKSSKRVNLYQVKGIISTGSMNTVTTKFEALNDVINTSMSTNLPNC
jgi:hypothetical protein